MDVILYNKISKVDGKVEEITVEKIISEELINSAESMVRGFRDATKSGDIVTKYAGFRSTTLIPVSAGVVDIYGPTENSVTISTNCIYYNAQQEFISAFGSGAASGDYSITVPSGVSYIAVNAYRQDTTDYTAVPSGFIVNINNAKVVQKETKVKPEKIDSNFAGLNGTQSFNFGIPLKRIKQFLDQ